MVDCLKTEFCFSILTADRDLGESSSYAGISANQWIDQDGVFLCYISSDLSWPLRLWCLLRKYDGDALHLNSFFSIRFSIVPLLIWRVLKPRKPIILGPRGEFSIGALGLKSFKKRVFLKCVKLSGIYRSVVWHASSEFEVADIRRTIGEDVNIHIAIDIAKPPDAIVLVKRNAARPLQLCFLSRISSIKNLLGALQMLQQVQSPVTFVAYGPIEDATYWVQCQAAASQLPSHIQFEYRGPLHPAQVPQALAQHDLFFLPTLGENFGHVIAEALGCGLPVLISDATPWRNLSAQRLGADLPLDAPERFVDFIESCSQMPAADYDAWRQEIRAWALKNIGNEEAVEQSRQLYRSVLAS
ncbi:glycosyltransferase family 4 protein [Castellaniella sp.]|uniref:glycosyltransferase family 4 protein n=1 Tax=Castellaniella sp. TaxID=1955812 RepID=UPI003564B768